MKSYVLHGISDFKLEERDKPLAQPGEVLLKVRAAGICGSDIPRIYKNGAYHHPMIPGHEFSGIVEAVGEGVSQDMIGKRYGIFPLIPCGECSSCRKKQYEMCKKYNYLGSRTDGGFAEYVCAPEWNLIELPEEVSYEQAAMLEPMAVAVHAIRKSGLFREKDVEEICEDRTIAVVGLGTIGLFIVMFLKSMGYQNIFVVGNKDFQQKMAYQLDVEEKYYYDVRLGNAQSWLMEKTQGEGVEVFFECVGKREVIIQGIDSVAPGGTLLLVGNPVADMEIEKAVYWKILRKQLRIQGTWNSSFTKENMDDWHYVLDMLERGKIHPEEMITHRFSIDEMICGFELMRDKSEDYVKVFGIF